MDNAVPLLNYLLPYKLWRMVKFELENRIRADMVGMVYKWVGQRRERENTKG